MTKQEVDDALLQRNVARAHLVQKQKGLKLALLGPRVEEIAEAKAMLLTQQQSLQQLRNQPHDAKLKSPAHSVVSRRLMGPGDMASPQKAVFSPKWVRAYV